MPLALFLDMLKFDFTFDVKDCYTDPVIMSFSVLIHSLFPYN